MNQPRKAAFARFNAHRRCNTAESIAASPSRKFIAKYALGGAKQFKAGRLRQMQGKASRQYNDVLARALTQQML